MDWLDALILGLAQGLTEYLPVSSSGHLEIFKEILGIELPEQQSVMFTVMVHAATVLSTIVVLRKMFYRLCRSFFTFRRDADFYYVCKILVSCIPIGIIGVFFKDKVEEIFGSGLLVVGICLCVTALLLTFAYYSGFEHGTGRLRPADRGRRISWWDAFVIGCAQAVAVFPGLSRSGTTIATGILLRDKRSEVATFSFLMVVLPIIGEALLDIVKLISTPAEQSSVGVGSIAVGFIVAFVTGCLACNWMINLVKRGKLLWFAIYCVIMGVICIWFR